MRIVQLLVMVVLAVPLLVSGCSAVVGVYGPPAFVRPSPPPPFIRVWVPGHWSHYGWWVPGHWVWCPGPYCAGPRW